MRRLPLWQVLVDRGLCPDRKGAAGWIMSGRVTVDGRRVDKEGALIPAGAEIVVRGIEMKYVSRGGYKLEGALADLNLDVTGRVVLDAGASTGGFTDCLLQHGAVRVYAVDAGFGQLAGKLRCDPRVVNLERTNLGDLDPADLDPLPDLATLDLSYLSLKKAVPMAAGLLAQGGEIVCLVKPLFETADNGARRSGKIGDPDAYRRVLQDLTAFLGAAGFAPVGVAASRLPGSSGTREFFLRLSLPPVQAAQADLAAQIERAVTGSIEQRPGGDPNDLAASDGECDV